MWPLSLECGMSTVSWKAEFALRRRVSMSAIGSVIIGISLFSRRFPEAYRVGQFLVMKRSSLEGLIPATIGRWKSLSPTQRWASPIELYGPKPRERVRTGSGLQRDPGWQLPTRLRDARQFSSMRHFAQAD